MTTAAKKFATYLGGTLAPDLYESGREYTASDVKDLAHLIREPNSHMVNGRNGPAFIAYLKSTLIPDLRASGHHDTASDLAEGVRHWKRAHKKLKGRGRGSEETEWLPEFTGEIGERVYSLTNNRKMGTITDKTVRGRKVLWDGMVHDWEAVEVRFSTLGRLTPGIEAQIRTKYQKGLST